MDNLFNLLMEAQHYFTFYPSTVFIKNGVMIAPIIRLHGEITKFIIIRLDDLTFFYQDMHPITSKRSHLLTIQSMISSRTLPTPLPDIKEEDDISSIVSSIDSFSSIEEANEIESDSKKIDEIS